MEAKQAEKLAWEEIVNDCAGRLSKQVDCGTEKRREAIAWANKQIKQAGYHIPAELPQESPMYLDEKGQWQLHKAIEAKTLPEKELREKIANLLDTGDTDFDREGGFTPQLDLAYEKADEILALIKASHPAELKVLAKEKIYFAYYGFEPGEGDAERFIKLDCDGIRSLKVAQAQCDYDLRQLKGEK